MKKKRINRRWLVTAALCIALVAAVALGGTAAYFTGRDEAVNTFTMGRVKIKLTEPGWNDATDGRGLLPGSARVKDPTVTALEGKSYMRVRMEIVDGSGKPITDADRIALILSCLFYDRAYGTAPPNIGVSKKYETAELKALAAAGKIIPQYNTDAFVFAGTQTGKPSVRYYNYKGIFDAAKPDTAVLFSNVVIPLDWHNGEIFSLNGDAYELNRNGSLEVVTPGTGYKLLLMAEAIQSSEMADAGEAWKELDKAAGITREVAAP
jgi:predicted ribosomally synthesized peptide with SipW-like signal peptide